ncbi:MAG: TRAP transporter large permease subunit, partial [Microbacteriaceae bacterium]
MSIEVISIAILALVILVALVLAEMPIWIALAGSGAIGLFMLNGMNVTYNTLGSIPYSATAKYSLVIIPMFVLMGVLASKAGLAGDLFTVAEKYVKHLPGGLGIATILASGAFGAV